MKSVRLRILARRNVLPTLQCTSGGTLLPVNSACRGRGRRLRRGASGEQARGNKRHHREGGSISTDAYDAQRGFGRDLIG